MTFQPPNSRILYLPNFIEVVADDEQFKLSLNDYMTRLVQILNDKDTGLYVDQEILNAQQFFDESDRTRLINIYRKVVNMGNLPNAGVINIPHGIMFPTGSRITRIYGAATNPTTGTYLPIPYLDVTNPNQGIELNADNMNVNIITGANFSSFDAIVVLEYIKENFR
jgi:hypothetical protein